MNTGRAGSGFDYKRGRAFSLAEVLVATACLGVCLAPFLLYLGNLTRMQRDLGLKARDDAWLSFQEHARTAGLDAGAAAAFAQPLNSSVPGLAGQRTERLAPPDGVAGVQLSLLRRAGPETEGRVGGSGWEIARGGSLAEAKPPLPPLAPVALTPPQIEPDGLNVLGLEAVSAAADGTAAVGVRASSGESAWVCLEVQGKTLSALSRVESLLAVENLARGSELRAWCEYPGSVAAGDILETLPDGRKRWTVREALGLRRHDPSAVVVSVPRLFIGTPVLCFAGRETGASLLLTRSELIRIEKGLELRVTWPRATRDRLGLAAAAVLGGFETTLLGQTGPSDGSLAGFCTETMLSNWSASNPLRAVPLLPSGFSGHVGLWSLDLGVEKLGAPELAASGQPDVLEGDSLEFVPPVQDDGQRRGRLSARNGALVSTGPSLLLPIIP